MEPPISFEADAVRDKQAEILHAIQMPTRRKFCRTLVRGQYGEGVIDGQPRSGVSKRAECRPELQHGKLLSR